MAACAGALARAKGIAATGRIANVRSIPYLIRMKLFEHLHLAPPRTITEHKEAGRFIPLTQIRTSADLKKVISDLIPLLHAEPTIADPIRYVISELGRNVLEHADSSIGAFVCAQYFRDQRRIAIGIADSGRGVWASIARSHQADTEAKAISLALTSGISGATLRIGGNETNAGAGLFFVRSIAKTSKNFFAIYSGSTIYKLLRKQAEPSLLYGDPTYESHSMVTDLPEWKGTVIGIDISVDARHEFPALLDLIRKSYTIDVRKRKKAYYKRIQFE